MFLAADVMLNTPVVEGLNLDPLEFVFVNDEAANIAKEGRAKAIVIEGKGGHGERRVLA